jgi:NAD(P)H dehydrogenase (quinone)
MSQISARRIAKSHAAQNHWIAERLLDRSGIPVTHLRPTFFAEWLMYLSDSIRERNMFPLPFGENTPSDVELARFDAPGGLGELDRTLT